MQEISLIEDSSISVKFKLDNYEQDFHGELKINPDKLPTLQLISTQSTPFQELRLTDNEKAQLLCYSGSQNIALINNGVSGNTIWPLYIVFGDNKLKIKGVELVFPEVTKWLTQGSSFDISEDKIYKTKPKRIIDELITINNAQYRFKSNYNCSIKSHNYCDTLISESLSLRVTSTDKSFSVSEIEQLIYQFKELFSLLLAAPITLEYAWLISGESDSRSAFYCITPSYNMRCKANLQEFLMTPQLIESEIGWKLILENYFSNDNSDNFQKIWNRLPALFSHSGIWDFEVLGYVSILDSYCDTYAKNHGKKLPRAIYKDLKNDLISVINSFSEGNSDYSEVFESFKDGIQRIRNTNLPTFKEKYDLMLKSISPEIQKLLIFSQAEFTRIKRIRDCVAHGITIDFEDEKDITTDAKIKDKLIVLLLFLVYRDLGVSDKLFCTFIRRNMSRFVLNSELDNVTIDRIVGDIRFLAVNEATFSFAKKFNSFYIGIKHSEASDFYEIDYSITKEMRAWLKLPHKQNRHIIDHLNETLNLSSNYKVSFINQVNFEFGGKAMRVNGVCLKEYVNGNN